MSRFEEGLAALENRAALLAVINRLGTEEDEATGVTVQELPKLLDASADEIADEYADYYVSSFKAGENPNLSILLKCCPTDKIRAKVRDLCNFEGLFEAAREADRIGLLNGDENVEGRR